MNKQRIIEQLRGVESIAKASKFKRMFNQPIRYFRSVVFRKFVYSKRRRERQVSCKTFFGTEMHLLLPSSTDIYLTGGKSHDSEIRLAKFLIHQLQVKDTFIDVGGHYGYFTLLASHLVGTTGKVVSIEPAPHTYEILKRNCSQFSNIESYNLALSDKNGELSFYEFPNLYSEFNSIDVDQYQSEKWYEENQPTEIKVKSVLLSDFITTHDILPQLIKIDVEGAEYQVILGLQNYLLDNSPIIVLEYLSKTRTNKSHRKAEETLMSIGYEPFAINPLGSLEAVKSGASYLERNNIESDNIVFVKRTEM